MIMNDGRLVPRFGFTDQRSSFRTLRLAFLLDLLVHHRRSIRLPGHDYGGGAYFVTCCVEGKECLFGRVVEATMPINECGQLAQRAWASIPQRFPSVIPDAFQVMPDHWHGILVISGPGLEPSLAAAAGAPVIHPVGPAKAGASPGPTRNNHPSLYDVVGAFKSVTKVPKLRDWSCHSLLVTRHCTWLLPTRESFGNSGRRPATVE